MIELGQEVSFIPMWNKSEHDDKAAKREKTVIGTVIYVNRQNSVFTVEYSCGGTTQKETFKLSEIGQEIHIVRGGRYGS